MNRIPDTGRTGPGVPPAGPPILSGRRWLWLLAALTLICWAPVLSVLFTYVVADIYGCQVNEGSVTPCAGPGGRDIGRLLYTTGVMGWFMLVTAPGMIGTVVAWMVVLGRALWRRIKP